MRISILMLTFLTFFITILHLFRLKQIVEHYDHNYPRRFEKQDTKLTLVIICHNKVKEFDSMLRSLSQVKGIKDTNIIVSQSETNSDVYNVAKSYNLTTIQHTDPGVKIENRLARHFKWTFDMVFDLNRDLDGVIVLEDDFLFSPDFLEYFKLTIPLLDTDDKLFTVSAWNDIGFKKNTMDPHKLRRVTFFPGLGWYLTRSMWINRLRYIWKDSDWDWVVRKFVNENNMEIIIPEISRDYHAAKTGTYMNSRLFRQFFERINYNKDETFEWYPTDVENVASYRSYHNAMVEMIQDTNVKKIWIDDTGKLRNKLFAKKFNVWHEPERGSWYGIRLIWNGKSYTMLIDIVNYPVWKNYRLPNDTL